MLTVFFIIRIMIEWWVNSTTAEVGWDGWCCIRSSWVGRCILSFGQFTFITAFCWYCSSECHFKFPRKSSLKISCDKRKTNKNMLCIQKIIQFACLAHTWIKCEITKMCKINTKCTILVNIDIRTVTHVKHYYHTQHFIELDRIQAWLGGCSCRWRGWDCVAFTSGEGMSSQNMAAKYSDRQVFARLPWVYPSNAGKLPASDDCVLANFDLLHTKCNAFYIICNIETPLKFHNLNNR